MDYSVKKSPPLTEVCDSCFICNEEFSSNYGLAKHLLEHANEAKFKDLLEQLESRLSANLPGTTAPNRTNLEEPEFIKTSLRRPLKRKNPIHPVAEPKVIEVITIDDDESADNEVSRSVAVVADIEGVEIITIDDDEPVVSKLVAVVPEFRLVKEETLPNIYSEIGPHHMYYPSMPGCFGINTIDEHVVIKKEPSVYFCDICKKPYVNRATLQTHLFRHIRDPCFQCDVCLKKFTMRAFLRKHRKVHIL